MDRDLACGLIGFAIALVYLSAAATIPQSVMGDTVGAAGVPTLLGYAMVAASALFVGQRLLAMRTSIVATTEPESRGVFENPVAASMSAAGAVVICAVFILMFETAGYILSVALLIFAMSAYQGVRPGLRLVVISAGGAVTLWLVFALLLGVRMPHGIWSDLF